MRELGHGTCMASLVAGNPVGVARSAALTNVKYFDGFTPIRASALFEALLYVLNDVTTNGRQQKAIINYSHGMFLLIRLLCHHPLISIFFTQVCPSRNGLVRMMPRSRSSRPRIPGTFFSRTCSMQTLQSCALYRQLRI